MSFDSALTELIEQGCKCKRVIQIQVTVVLWFTI